MKTGFFARLVPGSTFLRASLPSFSQSAFSKHPLTAVSIVSGQMAIDQLADRIGIALYEERDYATVAGHALWHFKHLPEVGETFEDQGWLFEVVDMDGRKIDKLLLIPLRPRRH